MGGCIAHDIWSFFSPYNLYPNGQSHGTFTGFRHAIALDVCFTGDQVYVFEIENLDFSSSYGYDILYPHNMVAKRYRSHRRSNQNLIRKILLSYQTISHRILKIHIR